MRFGFWTKNSQSYEDILECCAHAEATGWDGLWFADHFMPNEENVDQPIQEAWSILAALAAAVPRVRLGPLVAGNTYRNPALTAKIATTIDHISGGRGRLAGERARGLRLRLRLAAQPHGSLRRGRRDHQLAAGEPSD